MLYIYCTIQFDGRTALVRATHHGKEETVDLLLNRGANIEASDKVVFLNLYFELPNERV